MKFKYCIMFFFIIMTQIIYAQEQELHRHGIEALKENKQEEAEKYFSQSAMQNKDADSYYQLAKMYFAKDDFGLRNRGFEYISQAHLIEPGNVDYHYLYAEYAKYFISPFKKEKELLEIYNNNPSSVEILFDLAEIRFDLFERHRSVKNLTYVRFQNGKAIIPPLIPEVKEELDTAEARYLKGLKYAPKNYKGLTGIIKLYVATYNTEAAIDYMEKMIKYYPDDKTAHLQLGAYYYKKKKIDEGYKEIQKAIELMGAEEKEDFLYNSVEVLLEPKYKEVFKNMGKEEKVNFMDRIWKSMDPFYLTNTNERLMEHYIRVAYADAFFSCSDIGLKGWKSDRGQVLIRYGEPSEKMKVFLSMDEFNPLGFTYMFEEYWVFDNNTPALIFSGNKNYFKLKTTETAKKPESNQERFYVYTMEELIKFGGGNPATVFDEVKLKKIQAYKPVFNGHRIDLDARLYCFKKLTPGAGAIVQNYMAYTLPVKDTSNVKDVNDFTHEIGTFVFDENYNTLIEKKETIQNESIRKAYPEDNGNMVNCVEFEINSRKVSYAFDLRRKIDSNYFSLRRAIDIPNFNNSILGISALVFADSLVLDKELPYGIKRGEISFYPKPGNKFRTKEKFYIYYEAYNLAKDAKKETNFEQVITIKPREEDGFSIGKVVKGITNLIGGAEDIISLTTNYRTKEGNPQVYIQIDLSGYQRGKYDLIITINDKILGKSTERKTDLEIY